MKYILALAKTTIEFTFKDKDLNAEGFNYWGFPARKATKEAGKSPVFREYKGQMSYDAKQLFAPIVNAIAELNERIEKLEN